MSNKGPQAADNADASAPKVTDAGPARHYLPPLGVWITLIVCGALIAFLQTDFTAFDAPNSFVKSLANLREKIPFEKAIINIITLIVGFIASVRFLLWFGRRSAYPRGLRLTVVGLVLATVVLLLASLRIDNVHGALEPELRWRWQPKADRLLPKAEAAKESPRVDLLATTPNDFPQFLGPKRNATVEGVTLARDWSATPPKSIWRQPIGAGWSAFSIVGNCAVTLEQRGDQELVTCYDVRTGDLLWVHPIQARHETVLGGVGPRSTPTIHQGKVYALGATGILSCLDGATGNAIWSKDLLKEFDIGDHDVDMVNVAWGRAASPLIVDQMVIVPAGGPTGGPFVSLVAYNLETGDEIWRGGERQISYSSPSLATLGGKQQIIIVNESSITGHDPQTGKVLWETDWPGVSNREGSASQTVVLDDRRVFVSKGYSRGSKVFEVVAEGDGWKATDLWHNPVEMQTKFTNIVRRDGYIYGLSDRILECIDETGTRQWKKGRYGHGQILLVGELILVLGENGELALVEANPQRLVELARIQALEGKTWNTLALTGPYLLIRNGEEAACYELPVVSGETK